MIKQHQEFTLTPITAAVCDEELTYFATGHKDGCIFVWSNSTGYVSEHSLVMITAVTKRILPRHSNEVSSLAFYEDKQLYSTDIRFHVNIYNLKDGSLIGSQN